MTGSHCWIMTIHWGRVCGLKHSPCPPYFQIELGSSPGLCQNTLLLLWRSTFWIRTDWASRFFVPLSWWVYQWASVHCLGWPGWCLSLGLWYEAEGPWLVLCRCSSLSPRMRNVASLLWVKGEFFFESRRIEEVIFRRWGGGAELELMALLLQR